jgi:hypothetical protein
VRKNFYIEVDPGGAGGSTVVYNLSGYDFTRGYPFIQDFSRETWGTILDRPDLYAGNHLLLPLKAFPDVVSARCACQKADWQLNPDLSIFTVHARLKGEAIQLGMFAPSHSPEFLKGLSSEEPLWFRSPVSRFSMPRRTAWDWLLADESRVDRD